MKQFSGKKARGTSRMRYLWITLLMLIAGSSITLAGIMLEGNVAKVGDIEYATIEEAVAAWGPGKTLTLLQDVTTTSTVTVEVNATKSTQNWTLNLGDHTWTASGCNAFQLYAAGGTVMAQNYGLKIYANQNGGITASGKYCIECKYDNSTASYRPRLEIHGGTYNGSYIIYYYSSSWNNSNISNGPSTWFYKSNDGTEPVFNGNFGLFKCPIYLYAGYFNGTSFNTYPVNSTANTNLYGGHFKTINAFPSASNNKGIVYGSYKVLVKADASLDVISGAPATYEASTTSYSSILTSYRSTGYSGSLYFESANYAIQKYNIPIILNKDVVATQDKSYSSGTLTIDATAEGSACTGNITLTGNNAKFVIKYAEGSGHYGVTVNGGQLHVEESVADGIVTRTYSRLATISDPEAKVGDMGYSTVYDAFYAIDGTTDNKTIVLQKDVTNAGIVTNGTAVNTAGKTVATFDLNGHSIGIGSVACGNNTDYTLTIIDSSEGKTGTVTNTTASLFILALTGINDYSGTYNLKVQGGTWQFDPSCVTVNSETHNLVDEGYYARNNGNGTWTVCEAIATIGKAGYSSLADAIDAVQSGQTILMRTDVTNSPGLSIPTGKSFTVDFGGHTYTLNKFAEESNSVKSRQNTAATPRIRKASANDTGANGFQLEANSTVTFQNGTINVAEDNLTEAVAPAKNVTRIIQNYANLNLESMVIDGTNLYGSNNYVMSFNNGTSTLNDTQVITGEESDNIAFDVCRSDDYESVSVNVTGTSQINGDVEVSATDGDPGEGFSLMLAEGTLDGEILLDETAKTAMAASPETVTISKGETLEDVSAPEGYKWVEDGNGISTLAPKVYVAQIDDVQYESLAEAVAAVPTDGTATTITMIADETIVGNTGVTIAAAQNVVLDLNGKTISQTGPMANTAYLIRNNGTLTIMDSTDTEQNGTGNGKMLTTAEDPDTSSIPSYATNLISNYGTLSIQSGYYEVLTDNGYASYVVDNYSGGTANISGGKLCNNAYHAYVVRMFLNSTTQTNALNISGTAIITGSYAVWMQYPNANANKASLNISGGTLEATDGYALYAGGNTRNATNITVDISGGHIGGTGAWLGSDTAFERISVSGGTFAAFGVSAVGGSRFITGGTYESTALFTQTRDDDTPILADTYEAVEYSSDRFVVEQVTYVAQIGDVKYKTLAEAVAAVPTDGTETTITMIESEAINVVGSAITIPANKNIILDLNGYQVVGTAESGSTSALITNKGTLTIKDSSDTNADGTGTGQLISGATPTWVYDGSGNYAGSYASNTITNTGTLTIESGYIENLSTGSATYAVDNNSSGADAILNVQGGLLKAQKVAVRQFANSTVKENTVNVTGGTIQGTGYAGIWVQLPGSDATKATKATLNVSGGTLTGANYAFYDYSFGNNFNATQYNLSDGTYNGDVFSYGANMEITDGTFNGDVVVKQSQPSTIAISGGTFTGGVYTYGDNASQAFISGGTFSEPVAEEYCAEGYIPEDYGDGTYGVKNGTYVAQIGTTKYETLAEAVAAVQSGDTITMITDVTNAAGMTVPEGKNFTLDFGGHTYTLNKPGAGSTGTETNGFQLLKNSTITFRNGTINISADNRVQAEAPAANIKRVIQNYANLTLENMVIDGTNQYDGNDYILSFNNGTSVIKNTTVTTGGSDNIAFDVCRYASYPQVGVTVTGENSVINGNIEVYASNGNAQDGFSLLVEEGTLNGEILLDNTAKTAMAASPETATVSKGDAASIAAPADYKWVDNGNGTSTLAPKVYVAQIEDGAKYETLQAAVDAAEASATINILTDFTLTTITTSPNNKYNVNINKSLTINGNGHVITSSTGKRALALTGEGNEITLKDLTIVNNKADWVMGILNNLTCTLDGTTIDGSDYNGSYNQPVTIGSIDAAGSVTLNVTNGSVIKTNDQGTAHYAVIAWHPANITVTDSKLIGWANIYLKPDAAGSTVKIEGSEMVSKGIEGSSNNFSVITAECGNNTIEVKDTKITTTPANNTYQSLFDLQGEDNVAKFLGTTTYETSNMTYGAVTFNWGSLMSNMVYFDETTKAAFEPYFDGTNNAVIANVKEVSVDLYPVNFVPEVLYYWATTGGYAGGYYKLTEPFGNGWLADGEFIALQKDIELTADIACSLDDGESFNFLLGEYSVTKGDFSIALNQGVSVFTDKQTDVFTAADAACTVVEEALTEGDYNFKYTVKTLEDAGIYLLIDGEPYERTTTVAATEVTYRRTFKEGQEGKYQAWFVPFDYTITAADTDNLDFYKVNFVSASNQSGVIDDEEAVFINIVPLGAGATLKGNRPYVVKPRVANTFNFVAQNTTLLRKDESPRLEMSTSAYEYEFYGNYDTYTTEVPYEIMVMNGGQVCWNAGAGTKVGSYRWYITATSKLGDDDYSKVRIVFVDEEGEATGIDALRAEANEIDAYFTLDGMKKDTPVQGLNIVKYKNGSVKKVYVK